MIEPYHPRSQAVHPRFSPQGPVLHFGGEGLLEVLRFALPILIPPAALY
jgi:hypothetical protein